MRSYVPILQFSLRRYNDDTMRHRLLRFLCAAFLACATTAGLADARGYGAISPSVDGTGKTYMGREIAQVMGAPGADWLDRSARAREERPDLLLDALMLSPGMAVADIGAGTGYYSWRIASRIGAGGKVYAVDVQPEMLRLLRERMARRAQCLAGAGRGN